MTYVQRPTELENLQDECIHVSRVFDPGTATRVLLGVAPRDMWLEHAVVWFDVANGVARTGGIVKSVGNPGAATVSLTDDAAFDFNASEFIEQTAKGDPGNNFVARGDVILLEFDAAAAADLGNICVDCQFTTRKL